MPRLKFTASGAIEGWHDPRGDWKDGEVREVTDAEATGLTGTFPTIFSVESGAKAEAAPDKNKMAQGPKSNK